MNSEENENIQFDKERQKVDDVWESKTYTQGIKITYVIEDKDDFVYIKGYFGKLEVRRCKFEK